MLAILDKLRPPIYDVVRDRHPTHPVIVHKLGHPVKRFNNDDDAWHFIRTDEWKDRMRTTTS